MAADELDELLLDRFNMHRSDLIAALKTLPQQRPWAASLTSDEASLLDAAGFTEDAGAYAQIAADVTAQMAQLYASAFTAAELREGLGVSDSRVRQRRLGRTLWAIDDGGAWVYPAMQFKKDRRGRIMPLPHLDDVLPSLLALGLHPTAVAELLATPQPNLLIDGQPASVRDWLLHGEPVEPVLALIEVGDWSAR